jgi:hypothetical protein
LTSIGPLIAGQVITAVASVPGKAESEPSDPGTVLVQTAPPVVFSPIVEGATGVSGTSETDAVVRVFVGGSLEGTTTAPGTSWSVGGLSALSAGVQVVATATAPGKAESEPSNPVTVLARPAADAGADRTVHVVTGTILLGGHPSADGGSPPYTYLWTITPAAGFDLESTTASNPWFTGTALGSYQAELQVTDSAGLCDTDADTDAAVIEVVCPQRLDLYNALLVDDETFEATESIVVELTRIGSGARIALVAGESLELRNDVTVELDAELILRIDGDADCR